MLRWFTSRFSPASSANTATPPPAPASQIDASGVNPLVLASVMRDGNGFPLVDWSAVGDWVGHIAPGLEQSQAWGAVERAWFDHLRQALGPDFRVEAHESALLLSNLDPVVARAMLSYVSKSLQRILRVLDGIATTPAWGHDLVIVFKDKESYYQYVANYYPDKGEFAESSGMFIQAGCGHFVTVAAELPALEPIIVHELTHSCLHHLPLPAWLNEGLAVNTERRLSPPVGRPDLQKLHARHQAFWDKQRIQALWNGQSFLEVGQSNELSYDLAQLLVSHLAAEWGPFRDFCVNAQDRDAGAQSAAEFLDVSLGALVCALLDREPSPDWEPNPTLWQTAPERGGF